jgi:glycosyltransferase involved in cell wall biosynthesis
MPNLTVVILTKNEEKNIVGVIENAKQLTDDVLIIDAGSADNTVNLAQQNGAKVIYREWDDDFSAQRNFALEQTKAKWVLYLDADERLNEKLVGCIKKIIDKNDNKQYLIKRKSIAFGREFNYGVLRPDFVARLFPKASVKWVNKIHEMPQCALPQEHLKGYIKHYTYQNWEQYFNKFNQYTSIWAQNAYDSGKKSGVCGAFLHSAVGFFQMAFVHKGILDGKLGFILCLNHFFYVWVKYTKLAQLGKNARAR